MELKQKSDEFVILVSFHFPYLIFKNLIRTIVSTLYFQIDMSAKWPLIFIRLRQNTLQLAAGMIGLRLRLRPDKMVRRTTAKLVRAKTGWLRRNFA